MVVSACQVQPFWSCEAVRCLRFRLVALGTMASADSCSLTVTAAPVVADGLGLQASLSNDVYSRCTTGSFIPGTEHRTALCGASLSAPSTLLKSCRDAMIIAQGKRGTSAALGYGRKINPSPFPDLPRRPTRRGKPGKRGGWVSGGGLLPRAAASAALPWAIIALPLRGAAL